MRVDFYLLKSEEPQAHLLYACRLLEKAYLKGHKIYVHCANVTEAECLDELLWTFKEDSFIPHHLQGEGPEPPPPVQIGFGSEPRGFNDILLNLNQDIPSFFTRFKRVIELVPNSEVEKEQGRLRYKQYRANGCELSVHEV